VKHGTNTMYCYGACRCPECKKAHSEYYKGSCRRRSTDHCIVIAYAERFQVSRRIITTIGTLQLCLCRSDEARRILLRAVEAESIAGKKANAVMNERRRAA